MRRFVVAAGAILALALPLAADAEQPANPFDAIVPLVQPGQSPPPTRFVDQRGETVQLRDLQGEPVAIAFVYTRCRDACPIITRKFGAALAETGDTPVRLVEVSIDPAHDTPRAIAAYAKQYGIQAPRWLILTGAPDAVDDFNRRMGVQAIASGADEIIHNDRVVMLAPDGTVNQVIEGASWTPADLAAQLRHEAGTQSSVLGRLDLALGAALAFCGGALAGRAGIGDLVATLAILGGFVGILVWFVRRTSAGAP